MPHSSPSGTPIAWKKTSTSRGVGAAPALTEIASSSPSIARSPRKRFASPSAACARHVVGHRLARRLELDLRRAAVSHPTVWSPCVGRWPSRPALSFSKIRGTAKNHVGLTDGR